MYLNAIATNQKVQSRRDSRGSCDGQRSLPPVVAFLTHWQGFFDVLFVLGTSLASMLLSEAMSWFFVYRTDKYKNAVARVKILSRKFEQAKRADPTGKKVAQYRTDLKALGTETTGSNVKSMLFLGLLHWFTFSTLSSRYGGVVVAKLPFVVEFGLLQGFSHRGLVGNDYSECAFLFIFVMTTFLRGSVQRALGFEAPKNPVSNSWGMPESN
jgi:hypothetical protein